MKTIRLLDTNNNEILRESIDMECSDEQLIRSLDIPRGFMGKAEVEEDGIVIRYPVYRRFS